MDERGYRGKGWGRLKVLVAAVVLAFAVTLAVVVGNRLSDDALAVLAGAVCGVGAAIPTSLLVAAVSKRRAEPRGQAVAPQGAYPPVVVVTPPGMGRQANGWSALPPSLAAPVDRHFTVVGGLSTDTEVMSGGRYS